MNANMVYRILSEMSEELSTNQMKRLQEVLFSEMELRLRWIEKRHQTK